jgi:tetratricopeptide (TPR) repeat protein
MTHLRVSTIRALAATLGLACAHPGVAQEPAAPSAPVPTLAKPEPQPAVPVRTAEQRQQLESAIAKSDEFLGAGKVGDAIALLEATEKKLPDDALVAASLGAAYEQKGDHARALNWVREGIKRDASQHHASEWLHARMLEAKIALAKDPKWLDKNRVLGLDFGTADVPVAPEILPIEQGRLKGADQLLDQIDYQLAERTRRFKPPEPVIGDLYASAGDLAIAGAVSPLDDRKSKRQPERYYQEALKYGAPHADLVRRRLEKYGKDLAALPPAPQEEVAEYPVANRLQPPAPRAKSSWAYPAAALAVTVALVLVGIVLDRRRRKRAEANPPPPLPDVD